MVSQSCVNCKAVTYTPEGFDRVRVKCRCGASFLVGNAIPHWVLAISFLRTIDDDGPGDTVARLTQAVGISWLINVAGVPCKCEERRKEWNADYPYSEL